MPERPRQPTTNNPLTSAPLVRDIVEESSGADSDRNQSNDFTRLFRYEGEIVDVVEPRVN